MTICLTIYSPPPFVNFALFTIRYILLDEKTTLPKVIRK